jgi:hypothetical protein
MRATTAVVALASAAMVGSLAWAGAPKDWQEDVGKPAAPLVSGGWEGSPVSLEAVKGNVVLLAFWNCEAGG